MRHALPRLADIELANKKVLYRVDFNLPMVEGTILDDTRLQRALPGIRYALAQGAKITLLSHLGRPPPGPLGADYSLAPIRHYLSQQLAQPVAWSELPWQAPAMQAPLTLCENIRGLPGEATNCPSLARQLAGSCDVLVMDAFAVAHRIHASIVGVAQQSQISVAGPLLLEELAHLQALADTQSLGIVLGGSKISTKIGVLEALLPRAEVICLGGGMANTLLASAGITCGQSQVDTACLDAAEALGARAQALGVQWILPQDVVVTGDGTASAVVPVTAIPAHSRVMDVGPATVAQFGRALRQSATVVWNGPLGVFEQHPFAAGSLQLLQQLARLPGKTMVGGGETAALVATSECASAIDYISTGGGAFLHYLQAGTLPVLKYLKSVQHVIL